MKDSLRDIIYLSLPFIRAFTTRFVVKLRRELWFVRHSECSIKQYSILIIVLKSQISSLKFLPLQKVIINTFWTGRPSSRHITTDLTFRASEFCNDHIIIPREQGLSTRKKQTHHLQKDSETSHYSLPHVRVPNSPERASWRTEMSERFDGMMF